MAISEEAAAAIRALPVYKLALDIQNLLDRLEHTRNDDQEAFERYAAARVIEHAQAGALRGALEFIQHTGQGDSRESVDLFLTTVVEAAHASIQALVPTN